MIEALGLVFGGVSRLWQHHMELKDKDAERKHEAVMYDKQIALADKKQAHDVELRTMDGNFAESAAEWSAMEAAIKAQASEAQAAGGWVAKFSAFMRPFLTFWHAVVMYSVVKVALFILALDGGLAWADAITHIYGESDKALCMSMVGFWFADRSLRKKF